MKLLVIFSVFLALAVAKPGFEVASDESGESVEWKALPEVSEDELNERDFYSYAVDEENDVEESPRAAWDDPENEIDLSDIDFSEEDDEDEESDEESDEEDDGPLTRGLVSWNVRKKLKKIRKQMPCGFPEYGIPPLAPLKKREINLRAKQYFLEFLLDFFRFRVDGLNEFQIKKFKVNLVLKTVKYHFNFKYLSTQSIYNTTTLIDLMKEVGIDVKYEGGGNLDFRLENLSIKGSFKYKTPILIGSVRIYKFKIAITLGNVRSNITGIAGHGKWNRFINDQIEDVVLSSVNDNQKLISKKIEEVVVPQVNQAMKGKKVWDLIGMVLGNIGHGKGKKCKPPADPWA